MTAREFNDLGNFCFRHLIGEHAADTHTMTMDMQHDLYGFIAILVEEPFQDQNNKLHRRVIVIQQQNLVEARLLGFGAGFRDDTGTGIAPIITITIVGVAFVAHASIDFRIKTSLPGNAYRSLA